MELSEKDYYEMLEQLLRNDSEDIEVENSQLSIAVLHDYHAEAVNIVNTNSNSNDNRTTIENALTLNQAMQKMLFTIKAKLENLLKKCRSKYEKNDEIIQFYNKYIFNNITRKNREQNINPANFRSYYSFGAPFFKDKYYFSPAPNDDYLKRKLEKELFPMELHSMQHCWTLNDKINLLQGVKTQVINYLITRNIKNYRDMINEYDDFDKIIDLNNDDDQNKDANYYNKLVKQVESRSNGLKQLIHDVGENFQIDWSRIVRYNLNDRHPENACITMWNMYLKPNINRGKWTEQENNELLRICKKFNFENWKEISLRMKNRSEYQCFLQFRTSITYKSKLGYKWTNEDDRLLLNAVNKYRVGNVIRWNQVVSHFPHKTKKQIYHRYRYSIDPNIKKNNVFTKEDDCKLLAAVQQCGENFSRIPKSLFPGRTTVQLRNRYNVLKTNKEHKTWTIDDDKKLLNLINKYGLPNWKKISDHFNGSHSRISCRTRYTVIKKFLDKNPGSTINDIPRRSKKCLSDINADNWVEKIFEIRQKDNNERIKKKKKCEKTEYVDKLRSIEKDYYELFKLSYNFKFGNFNTCKTRDFESLYLLKTLFGINTNFNQIKMKSDKFHKDEYETLKLFYKSVNLKQHKIRVLPSNFVLPPNWCTLVGFRALAIKCTMPLKNDNSTENQLQKDDNNDKSDDDNKLDIQQQHEIDLAKKRFRDRFFSIFYKTALLTQMKLVVESHDQNNEEEET